MADILAEVWARHGTEIQRRPDWAVSWQLQALSTVRVVNYYLKELYKAAKKHAAARRAARAAPAA